MNTAWVPLSHSVFINGAIHSMEIDREDWATLTLIKILLAIIVWSSFYFTLQYYNWRKSCEWNCRLITTAHATFSCSLSFYSAFVIGPNPIKEPGLPMNSLDYYILITSLGYFIYDLFWCLYHQTDDEMILIHHLASLVCLAIPLSTGVSAGEVIVSLTALESTNPVLQLRWFLRDSGYKDSIAFLITDIIFIFMFFVMHVICGPYVLYSVMRHSRSSIMTKLAGILFMIISYHFTYMTLKYAYRKYVMRRKKETE